MSLSSDLADFLAEPETGNPFNPAAWLPGVAFEREFKAHKGPILRKHVFAKAKGRVFRGIVWSLVWGYPRGKQAGDDKSLKTAMENLENMAIQVAYLQGKTTCSIEMLRMLNDARRGLSTASTTKIAYFAGLKTTEGDALIFDQQAITALIERNDPEFAGLMASEPFARYAGKDRNVRVTTALNRVEHYKEYLIHMHSVAAQLGVRADDIERFLYNWGRKVRSVEGIAKRKATQAKKNAPAISSEDVPST